MHDSASWGHRLAMTFSWGGVEGGDTVVREELKKKKSPELHSSEEFNRKGRLLLIFMFLISVKF